jgi:iron(III) transport system substrate-binding protein
MEDRSLRLGGFDILQDLIDTGERRLSLVKSASYDARSTQGGNMVKLRIVVLASLALVLAACSPTKDEVTPYTSVDQVFSEPVFRAFTEASGLAVRAVFDTEETKSTGVLNRIIAEARSPQADVFWSGDPVRPFLLVRRGLVEPYVSPQAGAIPAPFKSPDGLWTGFAARARVLLVNSNLVRDEETPRSIFDLAKPRWRGKAAIANPLYGTTTMHVAALASLWGEGNAKAFLEDLKSNGVRVASSNGEVKRLVAAGEVAFGLTDTDDANEARKEGAPVKSVYPDQDGIGALVMPTVVVLIRGGPHPAAGRKLIDFLLSEEAERRMAASAAHLPLRAGVQAPAGVPKIGELCAMEVDYARVAEEIERLEPWLRDWVGL